ncbi:MAG TPA: hypothetical protein PLH95_13605, partial [Thauera aminoaromatica]|nr:hypothetical protein [Thauera aminoaromatica]
MPGLIRRGRAPHGATAARAFELAAISARRGARQRSNEARPMRQQNLLYAHSGGVTAVINASAAA